MEFKEALKGIRVAEFCYWGLGPITGHLLADFGAEVIKIESEQRMDGARYLEPFKDDKPDPEKGLANARYNQNKHSILLNLKHAKAVELAKRIVRISDLVTQSFTPGVMDRLGLGYEELKKVKPDVIYVSLSLAGITGPYRLYKGHGGLNSAMAGLNDLCGWPDGPPCIPGVAAFTDHYAPPLFVGGIIAALEYRRQTGKGQHIDYSAFDAGVWALDDAILDYTTNGRLQTRRAGRHPYASPYGVFQCKGDDRWCVIAVFSDEEWHALCNTMGTPNWSQEERFSTLLERLKNAHELESKINEWTREQQAEEVASMLQNAGVPAAVVSNGRDYFTDPQLRYRNHFWGDDYAFTYEAPGCMLSKTPARFHKPQPRLGEYNEHVFLKLLGLSDKEYAEYMAEGVIG